MDSAPAVEGVKYRAAELDELALYSQYSLRAASFFVRGCKVSEADIKQGLELIAKIYRTAEEVDIQ